MSNKSNGEHHGVVSHGSCAQMGKAIKPLWDRDTEKSEDSPILPWLVEHTGSILSLCARRVETVRPRPLLKDCMARKHKNLFLSGRSFLRTVEQNESQIPCGPFEFWRRGNYFLKEQFDFFVCSGFDHIQCDCTCACAVACSHTCVDQVQTHSRQAHTQTIYTAQTHYTSIPNCGCVFDDSG